MGDVKQACQKIVHRMWSGEKITARTLRNIGGLTKEQRTQLAQIINSDKFVTKAEAHWIIREHGHKQNIKFVAGLFQAYTKLPRKAMSWLQGSKSVVQGYRLKNVHVDVKRYAKRGVAVSSIIEDIIKSKPQQTSKKMPVNLVHFLMSMDPDLVKNKKRVARAVLGSLLVCGRKYSAGERKKLRLIVQKFDVASTPIFDRIASRS